MIDETQATRVGTVRKVHGYRGEVVVELYRDVPPKAWDGALFLRLDGLLVPFWVTQVRPGGADSALLTLDGVDTAEAARPFVDVDIYLLQDRAESAADVGDLLSWQAFVGYNIEADGRPLGRVRAVDDQSENILFYIATPAGGEVIVPIHPDFVTHHDDARRTLSLHLPDGLLTIND